MPKVVFIVGSPPSGTTLLKNILGSHPDIAEWYEPYLEIRFEDLLQDQRPTLHKIMDFKDTQPNHRLFVEIANVREENPGKRKSKFTSQGIAQNQPLFESLLKTLSFWDLQRW
ncbi:MAG TPA: sulfotransferase [Nitrospiria bacterium]|jgi:hypothetical protein